MSDQWTAATFEVATAVVTYPAGALSISSEAWAEATPAPSQTVTGETWGVFGIHRTADDFRAGDYTVTHLPSGRGLASTWTVRLARRFCEEIAGLTDWSSVNPGEIPPEIKDAFLTAWRRAHGRKCPESQAVAGGLS